MDETCERLYVKKDRRQAPRAKPTLNKGDVSLDTIDKLWTFLFPPRLLSEIATRTNTRLQGL